MSTGVDNGNEEIYIYSDTVVFMGLCAPAISFISYSVSQAEAIIGFCTTSHIFDCICLPLCNTISEPAATLP